MNRQQLKEKIQRRGRRSKLQRTQRKKRRGIVTGWWTTTHDRLPLCLGEIRRDQLVYPAPVFVRHQGEEELREVEDGIGHAVGEQGQEQQPLVPAEVADVRQDVVEGLQLGPQRGGLVGVGAVYGVLHAVHVLHLCRGIHALFSAL